MLGIAESVIGIGGKILVKFVEDKDLKTKIAAELKKEALKLDALQAQATSNRVNTHLYLLLGPGLPSCGYVHWGYLHNFLLCPWLNGAVLYGHRISPCLVFPQMDCLP